MCRNIRTLFNFEPPATEEEIRASALQFVRKLSGFTHPSKANEAAFNRRRRGCRRGAKASRIAAHIGAHPRSRGRSRQGARARPRAIRVTADT